MRETAPGVERRVASMYRQAGIEADVRVLAVHEGASVGESQGVVRRTV
jgi:hypothetical protein